MPISVFRRGVSFAIALALCAGCGGHPENDAASRPPAIDSIPSTVVASVAGDPPPWKAIARDVEMTELSLRIPQEKPGNLDRLILYAPRGQHKPHSLGCVFIAPAGAPIFAGNIQEEGDRVEHLPYVKAGYAVAAFNLDGPYKSSRPDPAGMSAAYAQFRAADGGVVNGKNALEYVLAKVPEIDPQRLFVAGHSSAATFSLLFAEREPRLKGCIAYAPNADLFDGIPGGKADVLKVFPGIDSLCPNEHCERLTCPTFLFHAEGDSVVSIGVSKRFAEKLKQSNNAVTCRWVPNGDHHDSMLEQGIPAGIKWLQGLPSEKNAAPTLPIVAEGAARGATIR